MPHTDKLETFDLNKNGFKIAFGVVDYIDGNMVEEQDTVGWNVYLDTWKSLEKVDVQQV